MQAVEVPDELVDACGDDPNLLCEWVFDRTDHQTWARLADWFVDRPLRILFIIVFAWFINRVLGRVVTRFAEELAERSGRDPVREAEDAEVDNPLLRTVERLRLTSEQEGRSKRRALTLGAMMRSFVGIAVWTTAIVMILGELGVSLGPLIASAGIAGIAIGFGAQSLVRDVLAGAFVIIEDQYGVGDVIDAGDATGVVEEVGFRTTKIRDIEGVLWTIPNGTISRVGNHSQVWSRVVFDIDVAYDTDLDAACAVMKTVLDDCWHAQSGATTIIEEPEVLGVQSFGPDAVTIRAIAKTDPSEQWATARWVRGELKKAFDAAGIVIPFPQRRVWVENGSLGLEAPFDADS